MMNMVTLKHGLKKGLLTGLMLLVSIYAWTQVPKVNIPAPEPTNPEPKATLTDTLKPGEDRHDRLPSFSADTDQRYFLFYDSRDPTNRHIPISVWGVRVGVRFPNNIKIGVGYYFTRQALRYPQPFGPDRVLVGRRLKYLMAYVEPFIFRRRWLDLSVPIEAGYGFARYDLASSIPDQPTVQFGNFVPIGVGVSAAFKLPLSNKFTPLRWIGISAYIGYRYAFQNTVADKSINYAGIFYSIGPTFFFDRMRNDYQVWRQRRKKK